jgi:hypothetical protein
VSSGNADKDSSKLDTRNHSRCYPLLEVANGRQKYYTNKLFQIYKTTPPAIGSGFFPARAWKK